MNGHNQNDVFVSTLLNTDIYSDTIQMVFRYSTVGIVQPLCVLRWDCLQRTLVVNVEKRVRISEATRDTKNSSLLCWRAARTFYQMVSFAPKFKDLNMYNASYCSRVFQHWNYAKSIRTEIHQKKKEDCLPCIVL